MTVGYGSAVRIIGGILNIARLRKNFFGDRYEEEERPKGI